VIVRRIDWYHSMTLSIGSVWCINVYLTFTTVQRTILDWGSTSLPLAQFTLKVLTNEKRGGLTVILSDRSRFQLFTLKFSKKSVQSSSCERPRTAQRTMFLLFANNNCLPITQCVGGVWKNPWNLHATWRIQTSLLVLCRHFKYR
jgi:hypothetical protein